MNGMRLYALQRLSALVMAPLVFVHLGVIVYAVGGGLSAGEILSRTQGSFGWALFYGLFVVAASVHAAIGLRTVLIEWSPMNARTSGLAAGFIGVCLLILGTRAVSAVVFS